MKERGRERERERERKEVRKERERERDCRLLAGSLDFGYELDYQDFVFVFVSVCELTHYND